MADTPHVTVKLRRYSPASGFDWTEYTVPYEDRMSVLTVLRWIYANEDPTVTFRQEQCGRGICNVCLAKIGGKVQKTCAVPVQPGDEIVLEAQNPRKILRDLVCAND